MKLKPNDNVRKILENAASSRNVLDLLKQMDPICHCLELMQCPDTSLGMAFDLWLELIQRLEGTLLFHFIKCSLPHYSLGTSAVSLARGRAEQLLSYDYAILAHILDPRLDALPPMFVVKARQFASSLGDQGWVFFCSPTLIGALWRSNWMSTLRGRVHTAGSDGETQNCGGVPVWRRAIQRS